MRQLYKLRFKPLQVEFRRLMPQEGAEPYEALFRTNELFAAGRTVHL